MKMRQKLIMLFSLMAFLTTAANTLYFLNIEMEALRSNTSKNMTVVGEKMVDEIEQYVQMMDYAMESMTSNARFMESMYLLDQLGGDADVVSAQTAISQALYHSPINRRFYRVSLFNLNGLYISSQFENTGMVESLSDEAREIARTLPWLDAARADVYHSHLIPPHRDIWNTARDEQVFSSVRAAVWRGKVIGFLEVTAYVGDLERIFSVSGMEGFSVQALFDDGNVLYKAPGDTADFSGLHLEGMETCQMPAGDDSLAVMLHSKPLKLCVYIAQSLSVHNQSMHLLVLRYVTIACAILFAAIALIVLFSFRLTNSIRRLTKKVRTLPVDDMLHLDAPVCATTVTSPEDVEIRDLENVFNDLTRRLQISMNNEITMRQANLHAQLDALQAQINPHFIYNTLNIISAKGMACGNEEITDICDQFASMLRYSANFQNSIVTLKDELNHVLRYLNLAKARYEERLSFAISVPLEAEQVRLPKLILQPLVENTIKHGYTDSTPAIHITIQGICEKGSLRLIVRDNGQGFSAQALEKLHAAFGQIAKGISCDQAGAAGHIGLANTFMRLTYCGGGNIPMKLYNDSGAVIELNIPIGTEGQNGIQRTACG